MGVLFLLVFCVIFIFFIKLNNDFIKDLKVNGVVKAYKNLYTSGRLIYILILFSLGIIVVFSFKISGIQPIHI